MQRLSRDEQRGLRRLRKRGRAGATALELGESELAGLQLGARLVKLGLATVTRTNRFLLTKHLRTSVPAAIAWELANPMAYAGRHDQEEREPRRIGRIPGGAGHDKIITTAAIEESVEPTRAICMAGLETIRYLPTRRMVEVSEREHDFNRGKWWLSILGGDQPGKFQHPAGRIWELRLSLWRHVGICQRCHAATAHCAERRSSRRSMAGPAMMR